MKALLIIDMQMEIQRRIWAGQDCINGDAKERIAQLAAAFRAQKLAVIHIRHQGERAESPFNIKAPGFAAMPETAEEPNDKVFIKTSSSAFVGTNIGPYLMEKGITDLVVVGAVLGYCVNSTVRGGSDIGFDMTVVTDCVIGFGFEERGLSAQTVGEVTLAQLGSDFARLANSQEVLASL